MKRYSVIVLCSVLLVILNNISVLGASFPNDTRFQDQWNLYNTTSGEGHINVPEAWDITTGSTETIIAVIDSGIEETHEDLQGRVLTGASFVPDDSTITDQIGHGTRVAGVIAAQTNNATGVAGICQQCRIMPLKVTNDPSSIPQDNVVQALLFAKNISAS